MGGDRTETQDVYQHSIPRLESHIAMCVGGRIKAYQYGGPHAFSPLLSNRPIDRAYVHGVSLTHGSVGSRSHIWSFACGVGERGQNFQYYWMCPCSNTWPYSTSISFVGNDYFCDTGYNSTTYPRRILYTNNPLWDSKGCGSNSTCCQFNNPPWFCKTLSQSTTDDLEVRICNDGNGVDTPIQIMEIYAIARTKIELVNSY